MEVVVSEDLTGRSPKATKFVATVEGNEEYACCAGFGATAADAIHDLAWHLRATPIANVKTFPVTMIGVR